MKYFRICSKDFPGDEQHKRLLCELENCVEWLNSGFRKEFQFDSNIDFIIVYTDSVDMINVQFSEGSYEINLSIKRIITLYKYYGALLKIRQLSLDEELDKVVDEIKIDDCKEGENYLGIHSLPTDSWQEVQMLYAFISLLYLIGHEMGHIFLCHTQSELKRDIQSCELAADSFAMHTIFSFFISTQNIDGRNKPFDKQYPYILYSIYSLFLFDAKKYNFEWVDSIYEKKHPPMLFRMIASMQHLKKLVFNRDDCSRLNHETIVEEDDRMYYLALYEYGILTGTVCDRKQFFPSPQEIEDHVNGLISHHKHIHPETHDLIAMIPD